MPSDWTIDALVKHFEELRETDLKYHEASRQMDLAHFEALRTADERARSAALATVDKANVIALEALGKRLDLLNEFKETLTAQNATFALREMVTQQIEGVTRDISLVTTRVTEIKAVGVGRNQLWLYITGGAAFIVAVLAIIAFFYGRK